MKARILVVGEALWDLRAPRGVGLDVAPSVWLEPGGGALNAARALAALGHRVSLGCSVGDDAVGRALLARAKAFGVDVGPAKAMRARTGLAFIELGANGARRVVPHRARDEAPPPWPPGRYAAVVASGVAPSWRFRGQARAARTAGALVAVDLNARLGVFRGRASRACLGVLGGAHVVKASRDDLAVLGLDIAEFRTRAANAELLVVTDGPRPVLAVGSFGSRRFPVRAVRGADSTGAGDAFFAALVAARLDTGDALASVAPALAAARAHVSTSSPRKP